MQPANSPDLAVRLNVKAKYAFRIRTISTPITTGSRNRDSDDAMNRFEIRIETTPVRKRAIAKPAVTAGPLCNSSHSNILLGRIGLRFLIGRGEKPSQLHRSVMS